MIQNGSQEYVRTIQNSAQMELKMAQRAYKDARECMMTSPFAQKHHWKIEL